MAEGIVYLDVDDEITSAASRIRTAPGTKVALVVPYGSRIATSRMNFRLLSREAVVSNRRLSIVAGDAAARSLAASAGLPVFATVGEYETSLAGPASQTASPPGEGGVESGGGGGGGIVASETVVATGPIVTAVAAAGTEAAPPRPRTSAATPATPVTRERKSQRPKRPPPDAATVATPGPPVAPLPAGPGPRPGRATGRGPLVSLDDPFADDQDDRPAGRSRAPLVAAIGLIGLAVVVAAVAAYLFLPAATIAVTPRRDPIGPIELTISANPDATAVDAAAGVVPAIRLDVPVQATKTFTTTGTKVTETPATGSVTFTNYDPTSSNTIASGSVVSTEGGIRFRTLSTLVVPRAAFTPPSTTVPASASVKIQAVAPGTAGNVPTNAIRVVPPGENPLFLAVANPDPTAGGTHTETPQVAKAEVDKAVAEVQGDLEAAFRQLIAAGAGAPPDTTVFPATATLGTATPDVDPKTLVGQAVDSFDIGLSATGTVIAVDPRPIHGLAEDALKARIEAGHRLVDGSVDISVGQGGVGEDGQVTFQATARATEIAVVDANAVRELIKGKTVAEAATALARYGTATITLWPDWVTTITGVDARLSITIDDGSGSGGPGGSAAPSDRASLRPSAGSARPSAATRASAAPSASNAP